jgi:hypothetical protein
MPRRWLRLGLFVGAVVSGVAVAQERIDFPTRPGVTQTIYVTAAPSPFASAILFPGKSGNVNQVRSNFLIRAAPRFAALGLTVAVADTPSDRAAGMELQFRASDAAAADTASIVAWLKTRAAVPVWVIGTSRGSISAANAAIRLGRGKIAGVVLTSSVWADGMQLVPVDKILVPILIVHNRDDICGSSPFAGAERAYSTIGAAPAKEFLPVTGGSVRGDACGAQSPHGYLGIEDQVVQPIAAWMRSH